MSAGASDPTRVCLLVDHGAVVEWQRRVVARMVAETNAKVTLVVSDESVDDRTLLDWLERAVELREWTLVSAVGALCGSPHPQREEVPVADVPGTASARRIDCAPETVEGWKHELPSDVVRSIADDADVAVRFGFGFLVGDVLVAPSHGVVSFHHGDIREYRGQPPGCWEYLHGRETAGITLQRLTERLDAGDVVAFETVTIGDAHTYREVLDRLYGTSEDMLVTAVERIQRGQTDFEPCEEPGEMYTFPTGGDALRFVLAEITGRIRRLGT